MPKPPKFFVLKRDYSTSFEEIKTSSPTISINLKNLGCGISNGTITLGSELVGGEAHIFSKLDPKLKPLVKSNLQKCIRRCLTSKAIRSAYAMLSFSAFETLRRLIIIILEDSLPIPALSTLAWFMMITSKGYSLTSENVSWILGVVHLVCEKVKYRGSGFHEPSGRSKRVDLEKMDLYSPHSEDLSSEIAIVWSIAFRRAYGGMKGDMEMLENLTHKYYSVLTLRDPSPEWNYHQILAKLEVDFIDLSSLGVFNPRKTLITACVDQHSHLQIVKETHEKFPNISESDIQKAIWMCRGRINIRPNLEGEYQGSVPMKLEKVWEYIEAFVEKFSKDVIKSF